MKSPASLNITTFEKDRAEALKRFPVSRETLARLDTFVDMLLRWQTIKNLVAPSTLSTIWTRHILDSAQIFPLFPDARIWVDMGSGAGFPGIVIAILSVDHPDAHIHLIESNGRKASFLREVARELFLPVTVHNERIEAVRTHLPDICHCVTARALAPLDQLLTFQHHHLEIHSPSVFLKGQDIEEELTLAAKYWNIDLELVPSITNPDGQIISVHHAELKDRF
ncbi:MAG: 16S rRNA (guanine(527)-N(7))-methyltransferase RsmG [Hyphomicrobiales bacterium]